MNHSIFSTIPWHHIDCWQTPVTGAKIHSPLKAIRCLRYRLELQVEVPWEDLLVPCLVSFVQNAGSDNPGSSPGCERFWCGGCRGEGGSSRIPLWLCHVCAIAICHAMTNRLQNISLLPQPVWRTQPLRLWRWLQVRDQEEQESLSKNLKCVAVLQDFKFVAICLKWMQWRTGKDFKF